MRRVTSLDVSCPSCGANVGETCHELTPVRPASLASAAKHQATSPHEPRRRRAREENARLNPPNTSRASGEHRNDVTSWSGERGQHGEVDCADCGAELAHLGEGFEHLKATGHRGVVFVGSESGRVWSPIS